MKYELRHVAFQHLFGGASISSERLINELGSNAENYIGTFSEYNPIGYKSYIAVYVKKETTVSTNQQKPFKLKGFDLSYGTSIHGSEFNANYAIEFSKQDLLRIANAMDDTDTLQVCKPDKVGEEFIKGMELVTEQPY